MIRVAGKGTIHELNGRLSPRARPFLAAIASSAGWQRSAVPPVKLHSEPAQLALHDALFFICRAGLDRRPFRKAGSDF
jgi:hypothetical protein